jgi:hypothetical protein
MGGHLFPGLSSMMDICDFSSGRSFALGSFYPDLPLGVPPLWKYCWAGCLLEPIQKIHLLSLQEGAGATLAPRPGMGLPAPFPFIRH